MAVTAAQVRRLALALPGSVEQPHFRLASFRVGGRIFATLTEDGSALHLFVDGAARDRALALYAPAVETLMWGAKPAGVKLWLAAATRAIALELLQQAHARRR